MNQIHFSESAIKISITAFSWMASEIHQAYVPSLKLTSYGPTNEAAAEMMDFSLKEFVLDLEKVGKTNVEIVLSNLGWKLDMLDGETFSYTDISKEDVIQRLELEDVELIEKTFSINS